MVFDGRSDTWDTIPVAGAVPASVCDMSLLAQEQSPVGPGTHHQLSENTQRVDCCYGEQHSPWRRDMHGEEAGRYDFVSSRPSTFSPFGNKEYDTGQNRDATADDQGEACGEGGPEDGFAVGVEPEPGCSGRRKGQEERGDVAAVVDVGGFGVTDRADQQAGQRRGDAGAGQCPGG